MTSTGGPPRPLWRDLPLMTGLLAAFGILGFYVARLWMPLPIFATDEAVYLSRAVFDPATIARNPLIVEVSNGLVFLLIRATTWLGGDYIVWHRFASATAYLGGLLVLFAVSTRGLPVRDRLTCLGLAVGFPFYRFAFSNLPEGLYVGILALMAALTARLYRRRPYLHAGAMGLLAAGLVLTKPHGVAMAAAFAAAVSADAVISRDMARLPGRLCVFFLMFFGAGNLIQAAAGDSVSNPWLFFQGGVYSQILAYSLTPHASAVGALILGAMVSTVLVLAGIPLTVAVSDLIARRRTPAKGAAFQLDDADNALLLLVLSLGATLLMVAIYAAKVAGIPSESMRLWGRYFEFFVPLIWLAAAPALVRTQARPHPKTRLACAAVLAVGLSGLLLSFRAGVVLFPWDATAVTAFFAPDRSGATPAYAFPFRALAVAATLAAAAALVLRARALIVGLCLIVALGVLSTKFDHDWLGGMIDARTELDRELRAVAPGLPHVAGATIITAADNNEALLAFLRLDGRAVVVGGTPDTLTPAALGAASRVIVAGSDEAPPGPWIRTFKGERLSVFRRAEAVGLSRALARSHDGSTTGDPPYARR